MLFTSAAWPPQYPGVEGPGKDPRVTIGEQRSLHFAEFGYEKMGVGPFYSHLGFCDTPQVFSRGGLGIQSELAHPHLILAVVYPGPEWEDSGT